MNRRLKLRALDGAFRKPRLLLWLLLPLMGFGSVVSQRPLTPASEGFIDRELIGDWTSAMDPHGRLALSISRTEAGLLEIRVYAPEKEGSPYLRYRAYSSRLDGVTYANLELVGYGCIDCDGAELMALRTEIFDPLGRIVAGRSGSSCTFIPMKYERTEDNRLVLFSQADSDFVNLTIEQDLLAGQTFGANAGELAGKPCITEAADKLRDFYSRNSAAIFPAAHAEAFVRRPPVMPAK